MQKIIASIENRTIVSLYSCNKSNINNSYAKVPVMLIAPPVQATRTLPIDETIRLF